MAVRTIFLIRHGTTRSNVDKIYAGRNDEGLIEEGIEQAEKLGKILAGQEITAIHSSPVQRAIETAEILNRMTGTEIVVDPDLIEILMGPWRGLSEEEVALSYPEEFAIWQIRPSELSLPGRETLAEVQDRALKALGRILSVEAHAVNLLVTHVAVIRCLILYFRELKLNAYKSLRIPNLALFRISFNGVRLQDFESLVELDPLEMTF